MMIFRTHSIVWLLVAGLLLGGCSQAPEAVESIPLSPLARIREHKGTMPVRAPITVHDDFFQYTGYEADGEFYIRTAAVDLYPTDVYIVYTEEMAEPLVFLARSPHAGCQLGWHPEEQEFHDPCTGSQFTREGEYIMGPSPRDMDRLPAEVRDDMLWMEARIIYGDSHP